MPFPSPFQKSPTRSKHSSLPLKNRSNKGVTTTAVKAPSNNVALVKIITQADNKDLEKLHELQLFINQVYITYTAWNTNSWRNSKSTDLVRISQVVDVMFCQNLPDVVEKSLTFAECGSGIAEEAIKLCDYIKEGATEEKLDIFIKGTRKIATEAKEQADEMVSDFRNIRRAIYDVVKDIDLKLEKKRDLLNDLKMELSGLKKSLNQIKNSLDQQERIVSILIDWWMGIDRQLGALQKSLNVLVLGDDIRLDLVRGNWLALTTSYGNYMSNMTRTQDRFVDLRKRDRPGISSVGTRAIKAV